MLKPNAHPLTESIEYRKCIKCKVQGFKEDFYITKGGTCPNCNSSAEGECDWEKLNICNGEIVNDTNAIKRCGNMKLSKAQIKNGVENNSITNVVVQRTLNKTKWTKRRHVHGDPEMLSIAWGSTYKI